MADKNLSRIRRQFEAFGRRSPRTRRVIDPLMRNGMFWVRVPLGLLLILGGLLSFLPVLGLWMMPLGLLLLAIDVPLLRPPVAAGTIRSRRRFRRLFRRRRGTGAHR